MENKISFSGLIHGTQAFLSPIAVWATIKEGLLLGVIILGIIGFLEFIDVVYSNYRVKRRVEKEIL